MHYLLLFAAITLEIIATTLLKYSAGFTKLWPSLGSVALYILCFFCSVKGAEQYKLRSSVCDLVRGRHSGDHYNFGSAVWPETQYGRHSGYCFDRSRLYHSQSFRDGRRIRDIRRREKSYYACRRGK